MDAIEIPIIILIAALTDCIIFGTLYYRFIKRPFGHIIGMAKAYAATLGAKSGESKRAVKTTIQAKEAKEKMVRGIIETMPFGKQLGAIVESQGISADELFSLVQDPNFMNGLEKILKAGSNVMGVLVAKTVKKDDKQDENRNNNAFSLPLSKA